MPAAAYPYPTQTITATSTGLANPAVWNTTNWNSEGVSSYNALQVDVNHRLAHGLQIRGVYTFGKALDDGDSLNTSVATNSPAFVANPLNPRRTMGARRSISGIRGVINATYDLPFGRGAEQRGSGESSGTGRSAGSKPAVRTAVHAAAFLQPVERRRHAQSGAAVVESGLHGTVIEGGPNQYFNPAAFIQPASGTYGNVGRNVLTGPSLATLDLSLAKKFAITERVGLQFRSEFFNILNTGELQQPESGGVQRRGARRAVGHRRA